MGYLIAQNEFGENGKLTILEVCIANLGAPKNYMKKVISPPENFVIQHNNIKL